MTARSSQPQAAATRRAGASARAASPAGAAAGPTQSRIETRPAWQRHVAALLLLMLVLAAVFPEIALQGKIFASPDYDQPSYFGVAGRAAHHAGAYPLWNPYIFLGMPSFGSLMYTRYVYPPSEILAALGALPLAPPMLWLLFYYLAAGYGVFLLLTDLRCAFWAAVVGGAAFMLGPHLVSMGVFGHGSKLASVAYLPYLALLALRLRQPGRRALWIGLLALTVGLLLLRGHPQIAFYGLLMLGILGLVEIIGAWRRHVPRAEIGRFAGGLAGGVVLGGALAAALLLPVREYAPESIRGSSEGGGTAYQYATNWSLSPSEIATFFLPSAMGFGEGTYVGTMPFTNFPNYLGQACLLFGLAALLLLRGRLVSVLVALSVMALLVSFGRNLSFAYDLFYKFLPYFNKFRVPVMILVLLQFASSVLLGLGLSALWARLPRDAEWRRPPVLRDTTRLLIAATVTAVFVVILVQPWSAALATRVAQNPRLPDQARSVYAEVARRLLQGDGLRVAAFLVAQASVVALLWRRKLPADVAGIALLGLTVLDLGAVDRRMVAPQHTWPGVTTRIGSERHADPQPGPLVRWLQSQPHDGAAPLRILPPGPGYMNNEWMQWGISSAGGYHPAKLSRFEDLVDTRKSNLDPRLRDLFAVRWIVLPPGQAMPEVKPAYDGPDGVVYENPDALPRAWVTGRWRTTTPGECKAQLLDPSFDRAHVALLEAPPQPAPDSAATGNAQVTAFAANRVTLTVQASAPALVVLAEAWHPGWRARVDGAPKPVWPVDCVLRAVAVPAGSSRVELEFVDPSVRRGMTISLVALALVLGLLFVGWRSGRNRAAAAPEPAR